MFVNPSILAKHANSFDSVVRGRPEELLKNIAKQKAMTFVGKQSGTLQNLVGKHAGDLISIFW